MATPIPTNRAPFSLAEVLAATGGTLVSRGVAEHGVGVTTDTRDVGPGQIFVALRGERFDAHAFAGEAAQRGAVMILVERKVPAVEGASVVQVVSTVAALGALAHVHLERWRCADSHRRAIAITGSAGKTTTRVAIASVLREFGVGGVLESPGNLNNQIGVPMVAFTASAEHRFAVFECGTSAPGEIALLRDIVAPDVAVVTLVAPAHALGLGDIEAIAREKLSLFAHPQLSLRVGNVDCDPIRQWASQGRLVGYGEHASADVRVVQREPRVPQLVVLEHQGKKVSFSCAHAGYAGALAGAAAAAVADGLGLQASSEGLTRALGQPVADHDAQRLRVVRGGGDIVWVDDAYNASPESMRRSMEFAAELARAEGRALVLVLGEMKELGPESETWHEAVGAWAAQLSPRTALVVGAGAARLHERLATAVPTALCSEITEAEGKLRQLLSPGDLVLVKGSNATGLRGLVARFAGSP